MKEAIIMRSKSIVFFVVFALCLFAIQVNQGQTQSYTTPFTTSLTYQNMGTATAQVSIDFYENASSTTPINVPRPDLPASAGTSVFVGSLASVPANFQGSAVLQSTEPIAATLVQVPSSTTVKNRPLSNGISQGSSSVLIATVLKNQFGYHSKFSVQNAGTAAADVVIKFYNTSATLVDTINQTIQPGAAYFVDAGTVANLGTSFNGSAVIEAAGGNLVASAMELSIAGTGASAFEGLSGGATKVFMATALCNAFPPANYNSAYAIQNTNLTTATNVTVTYSNGATETRAIQPGSKQSFQACSATGMTNNFSGSAIVESTATEIVAIGKVSGTGLSTAFLGQPTGSPKLAIPYVRWSQSQYDSGARQRTFIAIQNVGPADLATGQVLVKYLDKNGATVTTHTLGAIAQNAKANSNPYSTSDPGAAEFGYYTDGTFGGSAIVEGPAGSQLIAVARVQSKVGTGAVGEDYNGITAP